MGRIFFSEEQRYKQWWIWLISMIWILVLFSVLVPFLYGIYSQEVTNNKSFGENLISTDGLIAIGVFLVLFILFIFVFAKVRLKTRIGSEGIRIAYPPFFRKWKKISREEIEKYEVKSIQVIRRYGGYGIRFSQRYGKAYILSGKQGLQLFLKNGKKLFVGTQRKQSMEYAMEKLMNQEKQVNEGYNKKGRRIIFVENGKENSDNSCF